MGREACPRVVRFVKIDKAIEVDVENYIAAEQKEIVVDCGFRVDFAAIFSVEHFKKCAGRSERMIFRKIIDSDAERAPVAEILFDDVSEIAYSNHDVLETARAQVFDLISEDRLAADFDHGLRDVASDALNAASLAACHNNCFHTVKLINSLLSFDIGFGPVIDNFRAVVFKSERNVHLICKGGFDRFLFFKRNVEQ